MRLFNDHWTFYKSALGTEYEDIQGLEARFSPVDIPHDWLIYDTNNLYEDSVGWYRRLFSSEELNCKPGERVLLRFDGVYMDSTVYVNGQKAGDWKYGYSAFSFDITDYVTEGENELLVQVRHQSPNSRWYSGAGIYRNVWLHIYPEMYLPLDGTYVSTRAGEDGSYVMEIENEAAGAVSQALDETARCRYTLLQNDKVVSDLGWHHNRERKGDITVFGLTTKVSGVQEWDIESPVCYTLRVELFRGNSAEPADTQETTVGFRRIVFDTEKGLFLNGRHVKVHGVCEHHDLGCLGAAFHKEAMRRKLVILRGMGVNALRTSHNMPAKEVMELADEMGFLVMSEAFDMWERSKTEYDYARFFKEWAQRDVTSWIRRDRNHPSLMLWSIGNEIYDTHADPWAPDIVRRLVGYVRAWDRRENAPITIGSNFMPWEGAQKCADIVKFAGYNYSERLYAEHHKKHPDWVIYGSETASLVHSRGVYRFPLEQPILSDEDEQCSALGNSSTSWGARSVEKCITDDRDAEFAFGQFLWTGFDYIGEPTPYQTKNSYFGQIDTAGFPKDAFYVFQAEWTDVKRQPMVHLYPYWDFNEGQIIDVKACTNAHSVELFVNGESRGRQEIDHARGEKLQGIWKVAYEPGEILAVAYDENGRELCRQARHSFGEGVCLKLEADKKILRADGEDLSFITISAEDKDGYPVENAMNYVEVTVTGSGRLLGMDNGDSTDYDPYKGNVRKLFNGKLLAVVASVQEAGEIQVAVRGKNLREAQITLQAQPASVRSGISCLENLMDHPMELPEEEPVRKVELRALNGQKLTPEHPDCVVEARVRPARGADHELIWKIVNEAGIDISFAKAEPMPPDGEIQRVRISAFGDGEFLVRCMSKSGTDKIRLISQLNFSAEGLGQAMLNPYCFVSAGLFSDTIGQVANGNEKGISMDRVKPSAAVYEHLDFGDYGSDEITVPIFAMDGDPHRVELWLGRPGEEGSELLTAPIYQKPCIWNVYQEDTWKLPKRIKGVVTLSIRTYEMIHIKGFVFTAYQKAFSRIDAAEYSRIYGDSFRVKEHAVTEIGNNVTIEYDNMQFGEEGTASITLWGRSPLPGNTIHILFTPDQGEPVRRVLEVKGTKDYAPQTIAFEPLRGNGKAAFIFLPGSHFDLESFCFLRG